MRPVSRTLRDRLAAAWRSDRAFAIAVVIAAVVLIALVLAVSTVHSSEAAVDPRGATAVDFLVDICCPSLPANILPHPQLQPAASGSRFPPGLP